jgi:putative spermidine/putrescine transport system substrate-binding protein
MSDTRKTAGSTGASRRDFLKTVGVAGVGLAAAPYFIGSARADSKRIMIRDPGGTWTKGFKESFFDPFYKETGIEVIGITSAAEPTAEIRSMVETGNYTWDIGGSMSLSSINQLAAANLIEPHKLDDHPVIKTIPAQFRTPYAIGSDIYSTAIGYNTEKVKKVPQGWKDFWDVKNFPGRRGLRKYPFDSIEQALMADGVAPKDVYPCDLDRAFKSLDKVRGDISAWWTSGAQATQMFSSGEVDMMPTWAARILAARDAGAPVAISWDQHIWGVDVWAILKGTPKADICRQFLVFACDPQRQAKLTEYVMNGPTQPEAFKFIPADRARDLATHPDNMKRGIGIDNDYWAENKSEALDHFNEWILG